MKNENVHDLKRSGKQPSSELKISQSVKLTVKDDAIVTERTKMPVGLYRVAFFPASNASSSVHPYKISFSPSKHIPKTEHQLSM